MRSTIDVVIGAAGGPAGAGLDPVARPDARILILGSFPGVESLRLRQYYANRRNCFWPIMGELVGASPQLPYEERLARLKESGIALWDVCAEAERNGSLDSGIRSSRLNDLDAFFKRHPQIEIICFNGKKAQEIFRRSVPAGSAPPLPQILLPSTSPAHAAMTFATKLSRWREPLGSRILRAD